MSFKILTNELLEEVNEMLKESKESKEVSLKESILKEFGEYGVGFDDDDFEKTETPELLDGDELEGKKPEVDTDYPINYDDEYSIEGEEVEENAMPAMPVMEEFSDEDYSEAVSWWLEQYPNLTEEELASQDKDSVINIYKLSTKDEVVEEGSESETEGEVEVNVEVNAEVGN